MKICPTNNVSHKAYFKENKHFRKLAGCMNPTSINEQIKMFKNAPNHEVEIIELDIKSIINNLSHFNGSVFNKVTKKVLGFDFIENKGKAMESLLKDINTWHSKYSFFEEDLVHENQYNTLLNKTKNM